MSVESSQHRLVVIEDEADLLDTVVFRLEQEGFTVSSAMNGLEGLRLAQTEPLPDLVLLDLMLPGLSGLEVTRKLRASPKTEFLPIIMVTAKGEEVDRVVGLELGADDYLVKPYSLRELVLRIRAVLRRRGAVQAVGTDAASASLQVGQIVVEVDSHRAWVDGTELRLTALEFRLLETLCRRCGRVQTRGQLLSEVWGYSSDVNSRTVDTHVKRLRRKLGSAGSSLETVRGIGYRILEPGG